jgi:hypothetical protein
MNEMGVAETRNTGEGDGGYGREGDREDETKDDEDWGNTPPFSMVCETQSLRRLTPASTKHHNLR